MKMGVMEKKKIFASMMMILFCGGIMAGVAKVWLSKELVKFPVGSSIFWSYGQWVLLEAGVATVEPINDKIMKKIMAHQVLNIMDKMKIMAGFRQPQEFLLVPMGGVKPNLDKELFKEKFREIVSGRDLKYVNIVGMTAKIKFITNDKSAI